MKNELIVFIAILTVLIITSSSSASILDIADEKSHFSNPTLFNIESNIPLFQSEEIIDLTIHSSYFDKSRTVSNWGNTVDMESFEGQLMIENNPKIPIVVETRGNSRSLNCDNKPLLIKISKEYSKKDSVFHHAKNKLKIVVPCKRNDVEESDKVLREYQQYKLLECLGLPHFKVRLFKGYFSNSSNTTDHSSYGFFIESAKDMGQRFSQDAKVFSKSELRGATDLTHEAPSDTSLFLLRLSEVILNNSDFRPNGNNVKRVSAKGLHSLVPYDFDKSYLSKRKKITYSKESFTSKKIFLFSTYDGYIGPNDTGSFNRKVVCPEFQRLLLTRNACKNSIDQGPLNEVDKDYFLVHLLNMYIHLERQIDSLEECK